MLIDNFLSALPCPPVAQLSMNNVYGIVGNTTQPLYNISTLQVLDLSYNYLTGALDVRSSSQHRTRRVIVAS